MEMLSKADIAALMQKAQEMQKPVPDSDPNPLLDDERRYMAVPTGNRHERRKAAALARRKK